MSAFKHFSFMCTVAHHIESRRKNFLQSLGVKMTRVDCVCSPHDKFWINLWYESDGCVTRQAVCHRWQNAEFGSDIIWQKFPC